MKVLFLDFDGVLTTARCAMAFDGGLWRTPDPVATKLINDLCKKYELEIVVSSTWRNHFNSVAMRAFLQSNGIHSELLHSDWKTENRMDSHRGREIKEWLSLHPYVDGYLILDDDSDMLEEQAPFFVQTDPYDGFLWNHYLQADKICQLITKSTKS